MLQRLVRDPDAEAFIRDDFVTQRNGRFVIPVRADTARPVKGIVHAASSSGATLFVEPMESVELNNELVQLSEREQEESDRILRVWTAVFRDPWPPPWRAWASSERASWEEGSHSSPPTRASRSA